VNRRVGALFQADGGTLFLDEVESLPAESQVFLLDVIEGEKDLRPLGADRGQPRPKVRFIYSTKVPLEQAPLRDDLVNRLVHGHRIVVPTLVERREDIPLLVASILEDIRKAAGVEAIVTAEAMGFLMAQSWPGHVRQLKELLRSTTDGHQDKPIVLEESTFRDSLAWEHRIRRGDGHESIEPATQAVIVASPTSPTPQARKRPMDMTREDVEKALRAAGGVMKRAAVLLGCSPTTLRDKRRELGL
jgi:DNA-binding NtrC family response regulator